MGEDQPGRRPRLGPQAKTEAELRRARQAKALRENLRRRKARDGSPAPDKASAASNAAEDER